MPAITPTDILALPAVTPPVLGTERPVRQLITAREVVDGAGFTVRRPFPGNIDRSEPHSRYVHRHNRALVSFD
jgi:hypothetical protein